MIESATFLISLLASYFGVEQYRRWSLSRQVLDVPNDRSSHTAPTPRGGGLVIVAICIAVYIASFFVTGTPLSWSYIAGAMVIATVSWIDDIYSISSIWRFAAHSSAAALVIWELGGPLNPNDGLTGIITLAVVFFWVVWVINSYNFMDGIDGIAGIQAVAAAIGWAVIGYSIGADPLLMLMLAVLASSIGFLVHNWAPARIFMGDIGSAFLGWTFAVAPLLVVKNGEVPVWQAFAAGTLFLWPFMFDSVVTLFRRLFRLEKVWKPHREHFYQKMVISGRTHAFVSKIYGSIASIIVLTSLLAIKFGDGFYFLTILAAGAASFAIILLANEKKPLT